MFCVASVHLDFNLFHRPDADCCALGEFLPGVGEVARLDGGERLGDLFEYDVVRSNRAVRIALLYLALGFDPRDGLRGVDERRREELVLPLCGGEFRRDEFKVRVGHRCGSPV